MKILRNYILKELFKFFVLVMVILTFVFLMGSLVKTADYIINKGVQIKYVLKLFLCLITRFLPYTVPMAALTATLFVFGRLSSDNEITAMRASGINLHRITIPVIIVGLIISLVSLYVNDQLVPKSHFAMRKTLRDIGVRKPAAYIEPGIAITEFEDYVVYIDEIKKDKLKNIIIYQPREGKSTRTIVASRGELIPIPEKNILKLKLSDGTTDEPIPNDPTNFYKLNFKTYYMTLNLEPPKKTSKNIKKKHKDMTLRELKEEIDEIRARGTSNILPILTQITRIHRKISMSFSSLAFILIGLPLAIRTRRSEKFIGLGIGLVIVGVYWIILVVGNVLALKTLVTPWISVWLPNIIFIYLGVFLLYKIGKR